MKKFKFRLEAVLRVREVQHDLARGELLAANRELAVATAAAAQRISHLESLQTPTTVMTYDELRQHRFAVESARSATVWARDVEEQARQVVEDRREHWLSTRTQLKAVERLHERALLAHRVAVRQDADRQSDEITTARFRESARV